MKKAIILSFVLALANIAFLSAQTISRPVETEKSKQGKPADKSAPAQAKPKQGPVVTTGQIENGKKNKETGKPKKKGQKQKAKNKGRAKKHDHHEMEGHKGHDHGKSGKSTGNNTRKTEKNSKPPVISPSNSKTQRQGEKN